MKLSSVTGSNSYVKNIGKVGLELFIEDIEKYLNKYGDNYFITYEWTRYNQNDKYLDNNFYTVITNTTEENRFSQQINLETKLIESSNIFRCSAYVNYIENNINK